jgi:hypothetical protein
MQSLIGHSNGPGIAAVDVLMKLLDELVRKNVLTRDEVAGLLARADSEIATWGESNFAVIDARSVVKKMRGVGGEG